VGIVGKVLRGLEKTNDPNSLVCPEQGRKNEAYRSLIYLSFKPEREGREYFEKSNGGAC